MTTDLPTIFSDSGCPSSDDLRAYLDNRLTDEEKHRIEAHLADCELCSDELEGLSLLSDPDRLPAIVEELEQRVAARKVRILRLRPRLILASAAALAALLISAIFIFRFVVLPHEKSLLTEQPSASLKSVDSARPMPVKTFKEVIQRKAITTKEKRVEEETGNASDAPLQIALEVPEDLTSSEMAEAAESLDLVASGMGQNAEMEGIKEDTDFKEVSQIGGVGLYRKSMIKEPDLGEERAMKMSRAMDLFNALDYGEAARMFQELLREEPANYKALYHLAMCYAKMNEPKKALKTLERVLEDPDSLYYQQAVQLKVKISTNEPG
ncbi:MAG: tetratricopeptide repeat protein [Bacteroidales bacterium]|nr:tetratricopeptide repeat protein [Bacteroidales bacterium]